MLELKNVFASYGHVPVLKNINIRVNRGEIVSLLGSNGAGKTTILKTILSLVKERNGIIRFEDNEIQKWRTNRIVRLGIGIVPEGRRLFPSMTVLENLRMGALEVKNNEDFQNRLREILKIFPKLEEKLRQYAGTLSGGEQAMAAIGRGLMCKPRILLLDEPSLGLAPILVEAFFNTIKTINENGTTILLIEQNARKALSISSNAYVVQKGEIFTQGSREELYKSDLIKKAYLQA